MENNIVKFPGNRSITVVKPREDLAHFPIPSRDGNVRYFTVPECDMYWWAAVYQNIVFDNPYFEGVLYFYSEPDGWKNSSYAKRRIALEISVDRETALGILNVMPYNHVTSLGSLLNDEDFQIVHDNALLVLGDDLEINYELGIFMSPTTDPNRFNINFVDCKP